MQKKIQESLTRLKLVIADAKANALEEIRAPRLQPRQPSMDPLISADLNHPTKQPESVGDKVLKPRSKLKAVNPGNIKKRARTQEPKAI